MKRRLAWRLAGMSVAEKTSEFEQLLQRAQSGAESAWNEIYLDLAGAVTGYLRSRGATDPDDLASETFLQVARDIHRFNGDDAKFRSWVFVIAHRRLIDSRRASSRLRETTLHDETDFRVSGGDVESEAIEQLAVTRLREIFEMLTDDQKEVLSLRIIADLSIEQTAEVLGKRASAVKALQRRGLTAVKKQFERERVAI